MNTFTADADPAEFTVGEVTAFLATATVEDTGKVKAAEGAGKARKGVMEYVPSTDTVEPDEDGYTRIPVPESAAYVPGEPVASEDSDDEDDADPA